MARSQTPQRMRASVTGVMDFSPPAACTIMDDEEDPSSSAMATTTTAKSFIIFEFSYFERVWRLVICFVLSGG